MLSQGGKPGAWKRALGGMHIVTSRLGALLLVAYVVVTSELPSVKLASIATGGSSSVLLLVCWKLLAVVRALRKAWQAPAGALGDAALAIWMGELAVGEGCSAGLSASGWCAMSPPEQWLVVGWLSNVALDFLSKMHFLMTLAITSWTDVRQRARHAATYLALLSLGMPFALGIVMAAALLSAPLLPVLGVPLFIVGFPRCEKRLRVMPSVT